MSTVDVGTAHGEVLGRVSVPAAAARPLHRLRIVRRQQGLTRRKVARRLNVDLRQVRHQERETTDLLLSELYAWQKVLDVPVANLLVDADESLASPILERSQLLRLMKTVMAVHERARQESIRRMAQTMYDQLVEMMPELAAATPWHAVGKRRRLSEVGVTAQRRLAEEVFLDQGEWSVG